MITEIGAALLGGGISALGGIGGSVVQGLFNQSEAQKNREFQERMSNTAIQRLVADAQAAGISPSLVLGGGASTPMGNTASISQPNAGEIMSNTANKIIDIMKEDRRLDALERMQDERLETRQAMQDQRLNHATQMKMANSTTGNNRYKKEDFKNLFDNDRLDTIKF